ncbi:MFS transporter [Kroppenstedtia pulmonis]|uniref:MFS transporter n=1 Tax=Kroppenstedtia pulmonis TaxID=1380685 RepID=A0A7D3XJ66_9BACL|nr:MFS transporter [Kroppenstedtia pulmonis]QKG84619.1 MFS transporter [Kroppenstedtia pulmonis]
MKMKLKGLWLHRDFRNLWFGQTIAMFGSHITLLAFPLLAALYLDATPFQMGVLYAVEFLPVIVIGLHAGVWVDMKPKRPMLITVDILRALFIFMIPVAMYFDFLRIELLYVVVFLIGVNTVFSDIGQLSYLPFIIKKEELIEGNSKMEFSSSSASIVGQSLGGALIQAFTAPMAVIITACTFLSSALFLTRIKKKEPPIQKVDKKEEKILGQIAEGLKFVTKNKVIRGLTISAMIFNFFTVLMEPIFILYVSRGLGLPPVYIGLIFAMSGVGALLGAFIAETMTKKLGIGPCIVISLIIAGIATLMIPLATLLPMYLSIALLIFVQIVDSSMVIVHNINQRSLRVSITPDNLMGRMNASIRFCIMGTVPLGALIGGALGSWIGTLETLIVGALGILLAAIYLAMSSIRSIQHLPKNPAQEEVNV